MRLSRVLSIVCAAPAAAVGMGLAMPASAGVDILETFDGGTINTHNGTTVDWSTSGDALWGPGFSGFFAGDYWESGDIGDDGLSSLFLDVEIDAGGGTLTFDYAISSEGFFDFLEVFIDGTLEFSDSGIGLGTVGPIALPEGSVHIQFLYIKDGSVSSGFDAAGIDNVSVTNVVPGPGALALLSVAGVVLPGVRRRRRAL